MVESDSDSTVVSNADSFSSVSSSEIPNLINHLAEVQPDRQITAYRETPNDCSSISDLVLEAETRRDVVVDGWLRVKRTGILPHSFKELYCILAGQILKCSLRVDNSIPKYFINFDLVTASLKITDREIQIRLKGSSKVFCFASPNSSTLGIWAGALNTAINNSRGARISLTETTNLTRWWKKCTVTYEQFANTVETGDLLLFKSKSASSLALRVATISSVDHVAFVFTIESGEIYIVESLGKTGVQVLSLDWFLSNNWHLLYKRIVHRKLVCTRDPTFYLMFKTFASAWIGRPYSLSSSKLFRTNSHEDEFDSFFCSQLVAAFYKKLDLLPHHISSCKYWPADFSSSRALKLTEPAYLGEERLVKFDY